MTRIRLLGTIGAAILVVVVVTVAGSRPAAQTRDTSADTSELRAQTQVLRDLVSEVRALRSVIEGYTQGQIQSQTMGDLMSVQQRQVTDANARLDIARRELEGVSTNNRRMAAEIAGLEELLRRMTDPRERAGTEMQLRQQKDELERATNQENQVRSRESELQGLVNYEQSRWNELVDRMNRTLSR